MSGSKLRVSVEDIREDGNILVMKDRSILDDIDDDDSEDIVEMEDLDIAAKEREERNKRKAKHGSKYDPLNEDEDNASGGLLSKYDNFEEVEKDRAKSKQLELGIGTVLRARPSAAAAASMDENEYDDSTEMASSISIGRVPVRPAPSGHDSTSLSVEEKLRYQSDYIEASSSTNISEKFKKGKRKKNKRKLENEDESEPETIVSIPHTAEQDEELYAQLARLRRQKQQVVAAIPDGDTGADYISKTVAATDREMKEQDEPVAISSGIVDFISRISPIGDEQEEGRVQPENIAEINLPEGVRDVDMNDNEQAVAPLFKRDEILEDVTVDSGLSCALKFFQSRGMVDSSDRTDHLGDDEDIHIERRDEFGNSITDAKEAFKQLSWRFHGKKPSAKKQEKRLRKLENH